MSVKEAFFTICEDAKPAKGNYVSLYLQTPYYGGPEEGGWWGSDTHLIASKWFPTEESADAAKQAVEMEAERLNDESRKEFGEQCLREMHWLEARGLDADYLPEPDGEVSYYVLLEDQSGSSVSQGCRHYE